MDICKRMFSQMEEKSIFEQAKKYAFSYADNLAKRNVYPTDEAINNLKFFEEELPQTSKDASAILETLHKYGSPATVAQTGGRYFGFVNGGAIPVSLAVRWLSDFWDQNAPLYVTSPVVSKLESLVEKWLTQIFGLQEDTAAGFVSGTSQAILCGLASARYRIYKRLGFDVNSKGLINAPKIRIIAGRHAHGAVLKAVALLGFGKDNIEWVEVDKQGRVITEEVPELDDKTILILQAGNVNSGSFDGFDKICSKANKAGAWVHIDGAFGLWAQACEKLKYLTKGIEKASSWSVDAHKTLNAPYDSGIVLCSDREALVSALQATGSYIEYSTKRDGMLYTPEMSRRARIVELWASIKYLGLEGIDELVYGLHQRAVQFAGELKNSGFNILNDVVFNQVLAACHTDEQTVKTLALVQKSGVCWCGSSEWFGKKVIRISVCSWATTEEDVSSSVRAFLEARDK